MRIDEYRIEIHGLTPETDDKTMMKVCDAIADLDLNETLQQVVKQKLEENELTKNLNVIVTG